MSLKAKVLFKHQVLTPLQIVGTVSPRQKLRLNTHITPNSNLNFRSQGILPSCKLMGIVNLEVEPVSLLLRFFGERWVFSGLFRVLGFIFGQFERDE